MADEQIVTNIVATSDFSGLIADVQRTTAALSKLQQELSISNKALALQAGQIQKSFSETLRSTGQFSSHFVTVSSDVERFGKSLDTGKLKLRDYFQTWQTHTKTSGGLIRDLARQQVALQNAIIQPLGKTADGLMKFNVQVPKGLDVIKNKTALAAKELQIYNKVVQDGGVQLINWGKNTQWAGRQLTVGLTVPIAAFGAAASKAFKEADQQLVRLTKVYGGVAASSASDLKRVRTEISDTAKELAAAYGASYKETISLAADIAATGKTGNELIASTKETTRLAVLGEVDRQDAMKATLAIQNAFKQNTDELSKSIDFLNAVENQTSTSLADLIEAIPKAGPVIQGMGGSIKDLALYLTAMKEGGINASEGANALKSSIASLINPTKVASNMFAGFGIDIGGIVTKNAGDLTATIMELQGALDRLDPLQKQRAIEQLFGKFQYARMNALFANLGKQGSQTLAVMDLMKTSSQDLANVAGRELAQITESASGKYQRALEALKADLATVGEQFLNVQTFFLKMTDGIVKFMNKLPGPIKSLLTIVAGVTALAGPLIMLTGVFANFIGYIIKGIGHFKSLFKGGEGFKLLTPEILAAEKAGSLVEKTFYSDAAAADILSASLKNLITEFTILQQKAATGAISVKPTITTLAGTVAQAGSGIIVDPTNPLAGRMGTRASAHMNPVGNMTEAERAAQTIFGMVPGPIPVNRKIGKNPQMYAESRLPGIPGLTTIGGASTGVVASEAAKWHAMTGAVSMQSQAELKILKAEVDATGTVTHELSASYQALLPEFTKITALAAQESAAIVAQVQANKLSVEQARAKIVALNANVEAMIAETTMQVAASQGRTANLGIVPFTNQPVVDPKTGKSNMKEMFHKTPTADLVNKVARALGGIRTSGAGYSTETTIQKKNQGGPIYYNDGSTSVVPGPNVNKDVVPAMLTPGEFVVNKRATAQNLPLLQAINGNRNEASYGNAAGGFMSANAANAILRVFGVASNSKRRARILGNWGMLLPNAVNRRLRYGKSPGFELQQQLKDGKNLIDLERFLQFKGVEESKIEAIKKEVARTMSSNIKPLKNYGDDTFGELAFRAITPAVHSLEGQYPGISLAYQKDRLSPGRRDTEASSTKHGPSPSPVNVPGSRGSSYRSGSSGTVWAHFGDREFDRNISQIGKTIPGYSKGGMILSALQTLTHAPINKLSTLRNYFKARSMVKKGMYHGSYGENTPALEGRNVLDSATSRDVFHGMGFYSTSSPKEAERYSEGYNTTTEGGFGTVSQIMNLPRGKYVDLRKKNIKAQNIQLYRALGGKDFRYAGEDLGPILRQLGIKGAILPRISAGKTSSKEMDMAQWLAWADPSGVITQEITGALPKGRIPGRAKGGPVNAGNPYVVGEQGPELFVPRNNGGIIPHYAVGGMVKSLGLSAALQYGGSKLGEKVGGNLGAGISSASALAAQIAMFSTLGSSATKAAGNVGMLGRVLNKFPNKPLPGIELLAGKLAGAGSSGGRFAGILSKMGPLLARTAMLATRLNVGIGLITTGVVLGYKAWKNHQEQVRLTALGYGQTAESAKKAGLKYTDFNTKMKDAVANMKALAEKNKLIYESMTNAHTPLKITIEEYKKLKTEVKSTMPDIVKLINSTSSKDVGQLGVRLKTQFMAAGASAEEATKKVYALMAVSNKAGMAGKVIGTSGFAAIKDAKTAAVSAASTLADSMKTGSAKNQLAAFQTSMEAINTGIDEIIAKSKKAADADKTGKTKELTYAQATQQQMDLINAKAGNRVKLSQSIIDTLKKEMPELGKILNASDNIQSTWAKYQLTLAGVNADLSTFSATAAEALLKMVTIAKQTGSDVLRKGILKDEYAALSRLEKAKAAAFKAAQGASAKQQIDSRKIVEGLNKQIDAINKKAEAEKRALEKANALEDESTQIKKKQLEYQNALATGDMAAAAQAQLDIQSLVRGQQKNAAIDAIENKRLLDVAPLQAQIDAISAANQKISDAAALAGDSLNNFDTGIKTATDTISAVDQALNTIATGLQTDPKWLEKPEGKDALAALTKAIKESKNEMDKKSAAETANILVKTLQDKLNADTVYITAQKVYANEEAVNKGGTANTTSTPVKTVTSDTLKNAVKDAQTGKVQTKVWIDPKSETPYDIFQWKGEYYVVDKQTGTNVYKYDPTKERITGKRLKLAAGGYISGAGTMTSDSIPAMLSNGEYVVSAKAVQAAGVPMLDKINKMAAGGLATKFNVPAYSTTMRTKFNEGGLASSSNPQYNINVTLNGSNLSPNDVARAISQEMRMREAMNGRNRIV